MPFISQMATLPLVIVPQDVALAVAVEVAGPGDLSKSPATFATNEVATFKTVVPFISQIATLPLVSPHSRSLLPSPLKSWVAVSALGTVMRPILLL